MRILGRFVIKDAERFARRVLLFLAISAMFANLYIQFQFTKIGKIDFKQPNLCYQVKKKTDWDDYFNTRKLFFKVSNVVEKKNNISCVVSFPYAILKNQDFERTNFIFRTGVIIKNRILNAYDVFLRKKEKNIDLKNPNLYKLAKISEKYTISDGLDIRFFFFALENIINDFFCNTKIKRFKMKLVFTKYHKIMGYKITAKNRVVFYYSRGERLIVYSVCGKYYDHCKREISKEKFDEILNAYKNESHKSYPILPSYCRTKKLDTKPKTK